MRTGKSLLKKCMSVILAVTMITAASASTVANAARTVDDIRKEQAALEEKQQELEAQLTELESEQQLSLEYKDTLEAQIDSVQEQIDTANSGIKDLDASILDLTNKLKASEDEYAETLAMFKERIKVLYTSGGISTLQILLSAESLQDYSVKSELMKSVTAHDQELMAKINEYMKATEEDRKELEAEKAEVAELKKTLESKTSELDELNAKNDETIKTLTENHILTEGELEESHAYGDALANEMASLIEQMKQQEAANATPRPTAVPTPVPTPLPTPSPTPVPEVTVDDEGVEQPTPTPTPVPEPEYPEDTGSDDDYDDGYSDSGDYVSFQWPCPGYSYISAGWMGYEGHRGLDMAAGYGTPIYAAESGTVMVANNYDSWGYSWGYYVSIYHNSTYSTLYAHCSSIAVSAGQHVEKGQLIAYVGSTGNSTGNHLHFEVYQDGTRVDPAQFF